MYGLVLESVAQYVTRVYGADKWEEIRRKAKVDKANFNIHQVYAETLIPRLVDAGHHVLNVPREVLLNGFGESFVSFVGQYGYDQILKVLGRHMRDFLNGLDNLHEYLKFSYPKLKPPSFYCEKETASGLILHYRSSRRYNGYMHYVSGQIKSVGRHIYKSEIQVEVLKEELVRNSVHVVFQLRFNNEGYVEAQRMQKRIADNSRNNKLQVESRLFFDVFPFHLAFDEDMMIISVGRSLETIFPNLVGYDITHIFTVQRPKVDFGYQAILMHLNNVFEIVSIDPVISAGAGGGANKNADEDVEMHKVDEQESRGGKRRTASIISDENGDEDSRQFLHLKGQMLHVTSSKCFLFLGTPILHDLKRMSETGLFICDMSLHDNSRELVLAGTQQSLELKLAVEQEKSKSRKVETLALQLDKERRKNEELLFNYIPKSVIEQLRKGISAQELCRVIDNAVVVMCQLVDVDKIGAMEVAKTKSGSEELGSNNNHGYDMLTKLNMFYSKADMIALKHNCYRLETASENFVAIAGTVVVPATEGAKDVALANSEQEIALVTMNNALAMADELAVCVTKQMGLPVRMAVCAGSVVAGVLGIKVPRYCAFGRPLMLAEAMASATPEHACSMDEHCYAGLREAANAQQTIGGQQQQKRFMLLDVKNAKSKSFEFKQKAVQAYEIKFGENNKHQQQQQQQQPQRG